MPNYDLSYLNLRRYSVNVTRLRNNYKKLIKNVRNSPLYTPPQKATQIRILERKRDDAIKRLARGILNRTPSEIANFVAHGGISAFQRH